MAANAIDSDDLDFAFNLQLEEAISASLSLTNQRQLDELEQPLKDREISEIEFEKLKFDLHRRIHDHRVALEISKMPDDEWVDWGDEFERPFGEGSSKIESDEIFRVYFKGLIEKNMNRGIVMGGIGVAICDSRDELLFELRKPVAGIGLSRQGVETRALIEGLNAALELDLRRVVFYCDYYPIFKYVTGGWTAKQKKVLALVNQVSELKEKFTYCQPSLVPRHVIKFAFKLARDAIDSQLNKPAGESSNSKNLFETCVICLEDISISQIFSIDPCKHRYCFSCMKQLVEVKLLHGMLPKCPHEGCNSDLKVEGCIEFLTPRLVEIMTQRVTEASIPVTEKIYCPYPKCSALMSKGEVFEYSKSVLLGTERLGKRRCIKCNDDFCINCKVPWHQFMTCSMYKKKNPIPQMEEAKLKILAATNMWRQCVKCNHMIELAAGCYHMTCRCGYEFCYTCGSEWKNKVATCSCPLWNEENIVEDEISDEEDEEEEEYYDSDSDEYWVFRLQIAENKSLEMLSS